MFPSFCRSIDDGAIGTMKFVGTDHICTIYLLVNRMDPYNLGSEYKAISFSCEHEPLSGIV